MTGFDHVVIAVRDLEMATAAYESLLGRRAFAAETRDGVCSALIALDNIAVELIAPADEGRDEHEPARRLRAALNDGEGLKSLVFSTPDLDRTHRRCERIGLAPDAIAVRETWRSFRLGAQRTHGVRLFFMQRAIPLAASPPAEGGVLGLDHVVIRSSDMERAVALYGARLGLDLRLDREVRGQRLMFFRCGDAIVEVAFDASRTHDQLWGLSWRVACAAAARDRLAAAGVDVSAVREGMKPGTRVVTVRDRTCGVPTLMIEAAA